jgi:hypothetical protein
MNHNVIITSLQLWKSTAFNIPKCVQVIFEVFAAVMVQGEVFCIVILRGHKLEDQEHPNTRQYL